MTCKHTYSNMQQVFKPCYVPHSYCFKRHLIVRSGTVFIDSAISKNSLMALLAASIAELGIRHSVMYLNRTS